MIIYILLALLIISIYINFNLYKREITIEKKLEEYADVEDRALRVYHNMLALLIRTRTEIDGVDKKGSFSSDDEVGFAFNIIKSSIYNLVEEIKSFEDAQTDNKEEKNQK